MTSATDPDARIETMPRAVLLLLSGLIITAASPLPVHAQSARPIVAATADPYAGFITEASHRFGVPARWIRAVMGVESAYDPLAVSSAGAMGLMQVMPSTWRELRVRYGLGDNPIDPRANILAGAAYLREMHDRYGTITGMLAAYNAGHGRYDDYLATGRTLPAETRAYVATLAPMLGGEALSDTRMAASPAPPPPPDWREAPLFVVRADSRQTTGQSASMPVNAAAGSQPESIFLVRSEANDPR